MHQRNIHDLRRRKAALYASLLPALPPPGPADADLDDADYARFLTNVARLAPPGFGLEVGKRRRPASLGTLGSLITSCATLGEIFDIWLCYAEAGGELLRFELDRGLDQATTWGMRITPYPQLSGDVATLCLEEMAAAFFKLARDVTGDELSDFEVEMYGDAVPGYDYGSVFPVAVRFGATALRLIGPVSVLSLPVTCPQLGLIETIAQQASDGGGRHRPPGSVAVQLYGYFAGRRGGLPLLDAAALALGLSSRTLLRRLADEGTSFGTVLDEYRRSYAVALRGEGALKPKQIAHLVGFRSENSLRRAFKKWTGQTIGAWRETA